MRNPIALGFDYSYRRIGIAVAQIEFKQATPLYTLSVKKHIPWSAIQSCIDEWDASVLVVGVPLQLDGTEQPTTEAARRFIQELRQRFALPVFEVDERLTTVSARQQLFEQGGYRHLQAADVDSVAAQLILEQWLADEF